MPQRFRVGRFGSRTLAFPEGAISAGMLRFERSPRHTFPYRVLKRLIDVGLILLVSPLLLPVVAVISLAVLISSPGPIFFSHRRINRHGSFFSMWKFRTMAL